MTRVVLQTIRFLEAYAAEFELKATQAEHRVESTEKELSHVDDDLRQLRHERDNLRESLRHAQKVSPVRGLAGVRAALDAASKNLTPREALSVTASLSPERVEILVEAWRSAELFEKFSEKRKLFDLLWKLSTDYWDVAANGAGGDAQARSVFGAPYAARELEAVEHNEKAKLLRTFFYRAWSTHSHVSASQDWLQAVSGRNDPGAFRVAGERTENRHRALRPTSRLPLIASDDVRRRSSHSSN